MKRKNTEREELTQELRVRREMILKEVADVERDLEWIAEDRESELEERAQEDGAAQVLARLDDVGKREIEEIDETLRRIAAGTYGICERCHVQIPSPRLKALPTARFCIECAREEEGGVGKEGPSLGTKSGDSGRPRPPGAR